MKSLDYLKKYSEKYRLISIPEFKKINNQIVKFSLRGEQEVCLKTKFKHTSKIEPNFYHIWVLDDKNLCANVPVRAGIKILREYPQFFKKRYDTTEHFELIFAEKNLDKVDTVLKIRKKKQLSEETKQKLRDRATEMRGKTTQKSIITSQGISNYTSTYFN